MLLKDLNINDEFYFAPHDPSFSDAFRVSEKWGRCKVVNQPHQAMVYVCPVDGHRGKGGMLGEREVTFIGGELHEPPRPIYDIRVFLTPGEATDWINQHILDEWELISVSGDQNIIVTMVRYENS